MDTNESKDPQPIHRRDSGGSSVPIPDPTILTTQQLQREIATARELVQVYINGVQANFETRLSGMDKAISLVQQSSEKIPDLIHAVVAHLRILHEEKFASIETRLRERDARFELASTDSKTAVDVAFASATRAIELLEHSTEKFPNLINNTISDLKILHDEKFASVNKQFEEKFRSIATQFIERDTRTEQTSRDSKVAVDAALQAAKEAVGEQNKSNAMAIAKSEATFTKQIDQIGVLISTLQVGLDGKISDIKDRMQAVEGQRKGSTETYGFLFGAIATVIAILTVVIAIMRH